MKGQSPWRRLQELEVRVPQKFAVLPPIVLDRISTAWVLGPGNHLLPHYRSGEPYIPHPKVTIVLGAKPSRPYAHTEIIYE